MKIKNQKILVTSNEPWGDIWYSKQNYAFELARNNEVIFINPPRKWNPKHIFSNPMTLGTINQSLKFLNYGNYLPTRFDFLNPINNYLISRRIKKFLKKQGYEATILWAFDPIRLYKPKLLGVSLGIYHCVDYYYFQFYGESKLCKNSDLIFATSQLFLDEFSSFNTPQFVVPHGISQDEFTLDDERSKELNIRHEKYGLYIGVIDHRMDFQMYERVIHAFPEITFVFVGPLRLTTDDSAKRIFQNREYANVIIEGPIHFKDLKYYVEKSWFCMSFMDMNYHANTVHHHKTLVYLTHGKPIFSYAFEEYKKNDDLMYLSNDQNHLLNKLREFTKKPEPLELIQTRITYARQYTFDKILERAGEILRKENAI